MPGGGRPAAVSVDTFVERSGPASPRLLQHLVLLDQSPPVNSPEGGPGTGLLRLEDEESSNLTEKLLVLGVIIARGCQGHLL